MTIIVILLVILAAIAALAAARPNTFEVKRELAMTAAPATIFPHIDNLQKWQAWSPWARMDPQAQNTFSGPAQGVGASMSWEGKKTGAGTSTITASRQHQYVELRLDFRKPMQATNTTEFTLTPQGGQTLVTWRMHGKANFMNKLVGLVLSCDRMVNKQFDSGLQNLRQIVEQK